MRARAQGQSFKSGYIPAPIGGLNTVDPGGAMPKGDCTLLYNLIAAEYGLRSRLGYREWCIALTGAADNGVRSILPFHGSNKNGSTDKLFACTSTGIWDVTTETPDRLEAFDITSGDAGYGTSFVATTPAGRFLVYCDDENGLYLYPESTGVWVRPVLGTTQLWEPQTDYVAGNKVVNGSTLREYLCITTGESASSGGPTTTAADITDGTAHWQYIADAGVGVIGPCLADQNAGFTADPSKFVFGCVWKSRIWFVERDTSRAYYLDINAVYGTATSFDFGSQMRAGGPLRGLYNWSYDGGNGLDTLLVGISGGGDVVIYQGTDPSSASSFGIKGCWGLGAVPYGRRIATDNGSDLLVASMLGAIPLSKLVLSGKADDQSLYVTRNVANLFNQLATTLGGEQGWGLYIHPSDNALIITHPSSANDGNTDQLVMSLTTKGWSRYRNLPILCAGVWNKEFYFGTADGRVCRNIDYVDNVLLSDPSSYTPVKWSVLTRYDNLGNMRQKQVTMIRPTLLSGSATPIVQSTARYNFDLVEPDAPSGSPAGGWDSDLWDAGVFAGDYVPNQDLVGAAGMGRDVAIAVRGSATSRTVLEGITVMFKQGGVL